MQRDSPPERTLSQVVFIDFWDLAHKTLCLHEKSNKCIVSSPVPQGWITDLKKRNHHGIEMYSQKIRRCLYIGEPTLYGTVDENQCFLPHWVLHSSSTSTTFGLTSFGQTQEKDSHFISKFLGKETNIV